MSDQDFFEKLSDRNRADNRLAEARAREQRDPRRLIDRATDVEWDASAEPIERERMRDARMRLVTALSTGESERIARAASALRHRLTIAGSD